MRLRRLAVVGALATSVVGVAGGTVQAGIESPTEPVVINVDLRGVDPMDTLGDVVIELWNTTPVDVAPTLCTPGAVHSTGVVSAAVSIQCALVPVGDYAIGVSNLPAAYDASVYCETAGQDEKIDDEGAEFTLDYYETVCYVDLYAGILAIDKVIEGGDAEVSDFEFQVLEDSVPVDTGIDPIVDPAASLCGDVPDDCLMVPLALGNYELVEMLPAHGYALKSISCQEIDIEEVINPEGEGFQQSVESLTEIAVGTDGHFELEGDNYCVVTNEYQEGRLVVTTDVVNDNGGTAVPGDVSVEVFEAEGGSAILGPTACLGDGSCLDVMLPIGDYVIGYTGPDGYTLTVSQKVTAPAEKLDDPDAAFTIASGGIVEVLLRVDDPIPTTTTTIAAELPPTGTSGGTTLALAIVAFLLVAVGGVMVGARRRPI